MRLSAKLFSEKNLSNLEIYSEDKALSLRADLNTSYIKGLTMNLGRQAILTDYE